MKVVIDIETNSLDNPSHIWVIVCQNYDTGEVHVYREPSTSPQGVEQRSAFLQYWKQITWFVGHNFLEFDYPNIVAILGDDFRVDGIELKSYDTLILSRLFDYSRGKNGTPVLSFDEGNDPFSSELVTRRAHSLESYGEQFGIAKDKFDDYSKYSTQLEERCKRDVIITARILRLFSRHANAPDAQASLQLEHQFQTVSNELHNRGFQFNVKKAQGLLDKVTSELETLDKEIANAFPDIIRPIRTITPKLTRYGTLHKGDFRWVSDGDLSSFNGGPFTRIAYSPFNPSSHRQIVRVLSAAGWRPTEKTQAHIESEKEVNRLRRQVGVRAGSSEETRLLEETLEGHRKTGWKVNEVNLLTLPPSAPAAAKHLAKRILLESRRRTLTEWLSLLSRTNRIHGRFYSIGAWTHRMAHQKPNTANIPNEYDTQGKKKLLGKEMRSLWMAPPGRLLVGVDAEGIQLRIFAHYIDDPEFTRSLVEGKKDDKTDPHSLNQRILGSVCRTRAAAKRFIYALLLGAGLWKLSQILECSETECQEALNRLLQRYDGFRVLKETTIPRDAKRGWFSGLDGRKVVIPGKSLGERKHLAMSGYLQNGEAVVMKKATVKFLPNMPEKCWLVNLVHDEWQTEVPNNMEIALNVAKLQADSLREVGEELGLKCPLAGSYWNDDYKDFTIGTNWSVTH